MPATLDALDEEGLAPLHRAAMSSLADTEALLARGANVHVRSAPEGATPLHFAAAMHRVEIIRPLLRAGADPSARDDEGTTPLLALLTSTMPFGTGTVLIAHLLREAGEDARELAAELASTPELVQSLASIGFRIDAPDPVGGALDELVLLADALEMSWDAEAHGYDHWSAPRLAVVAERLPLALATLPDDVRALDRAFFDALAVGAPPTLSHTDRKRLRAIRANRGR